MWSVNEWFKVTKDPWILGMVQGVSIDFEGFPLQTTLPFPISFSDEEKGWIDGEVQKLLHKGVIEETSHEDGEFISNIFLRPKPNGDHRLILDLSRMNKDVKYKHFKMTSLQTALDLVTQKLLDGQC